MNIFVLSFRQHLCILSLFSIFITSGCQLVSLKKQTLHTTISNERNSILTQKKLSEASLNVLYMAGMDAKICMQTPEACIADLEKIPQIQGEQLLSTASELYLSKALTLSESYDCKINNHVNAKNKEANNDDCLEQELQALDKVFAIAMLIYLSHLANLKIVFLITDRCKSEIFIIRHSTN